MEHELIWNTEQREDLRSAMVEQATNSIIELESDRVEQVIVDNADILQDYFYKYLEKNKHCKINEVDRKALLLQDLGYKFQEMMLRNIDGLAEEDVREQME